MSKSGDVGQQPALANGEVHNIDSVPSPSLSRSSSISQGSLSDLDEDFIIANRLATYLKIDSGNSLDHNEHSAADHQDENNARMFRENSDFAEREDSVRIYLMFQIGRNDDTKPGFEGPRWFIAWEVGPEHEDDNDHLRLRILELHCQGKDVYHVGPVSRVGKLSTKTSVCIGELSLEERKKLIGVAAGIPIKEVSTTNTWTYKEWIKNVLNDAVGEGVFSHEIVQEALRLAEERSRPLRRESRRLSDLLPSAH